MSRQILDFVSVGPQRTATSWLHQNIRNHPQLRFPKDVKETMFFDQRFQKGWDWYWSHFPSHESTGQKTGEIASTYFYSCEAIERLACFHKLKVIINVRNPIERTYSLFRHHQAKGRVPDDYHKAIQIMPQIESSGRYSIHCDHWENQFGRKSCFYLLQEDLAERPQAAVDTLFEFLGVAQFLLPLESLQKYGQIRKPKSMGLARSAAKFSTALRSRGFHKPMELAKSLGLKKFFYGPVTPQTEVPAPIAERLQQLHQADIEYLEAKLGRSFPDWNNVK